MYWLREIMPKMLFPASSRLGMLTFFLVFQKSYLNSKCINSQSKSNKNIKTCAFVIGEQDFRPGIMSVKGVGHIGWSWHCWRVNGRNMHWTCPCCLKDKKLIATACSWEFPLCYPADKHTPKAALHPWHQEHESRDETDSSF